MECQNWYFKYQTKKECEDAMERAKLNFAVTGNEEITNPTAKYTTTTTTKAEFGKTDQVDTGTEEITNPATKYTTTTTTKAEFGKTDQADTGTEAKTGDTTWTTTTFVPEDDLVTEFNLEDDTTLAPYKPTEVDTTLKPEKKEDILDVQIETPNLQVQVKRRKGVDGEVMTVVIVSEIGLMAVISCLFYFGMKIFGRWWRNNRGENYNLHQAEQSHVPLHQNQAQNPEDTIRPRIQEAEESDEGSDVPMGYSTAIGTTQLTNSTRLDFSPIGPFPNRTVSMSVLDTDQRPGPMEKRSNSGPIPINIDDEIEDQIPEMEASQILQQSPLRTVDAIIHNQPESDGSETGRRYPLRKRKSPVRYGY